MTEPAPGDVLAGRVIAIAEARELDLFAGLLERRGARVLRYPLVQIIDAPDPQPILDWCHRLAADGFDDLILLTGEGLRRLLGCIDRHEPGLRGAFVNALARLRTITRGPKPARVLRELKLEATLAADVPTTAGVIERLRALDLHGRRMAVQLYGDDPNRALVEFLQQAGAARVDAVAPYRYADASTDRVVSELLERMQSGGIDAIAFTSKAQIQRLLRVGGPERVRLALKATAVAAVGPVVRATLLDQGIDVQAMPQHSWFLKPLTAALSALLAEGRASERI